MNKLILEEIQRMNLLSNYDNSKTLSEQLLPPTPNPVVNPFEKLNFTNFTNFSPTAQSNKQPAALATAAVPESENKANWEDVVKYYSGNTNSNWKFKEKGTFAQGGEYLTVNSTDTKDTDVYMDVEYDGDVFIWNKGQGTGSSRGTWEWDGTKPVIKFKNISKNASGYAQPTDTDWSAVTTNNKIIGLNAKGPLIKQVQNKLIEFGYSGTSLGSITTDVEGCKFDVEKCDGIYGKLTKEMVKQYQKDNGLAVDGIVGQQTYDAMF